MRLLILIPTLCLLACSPKVIDEDAGTTDTAGAADTGTTDTGATEDGTEATTGDVGADQCPADFPEPGTSIELGEKMMNIELNNCAKEPSSARDLLCRNKLVLISFGAGWCEPCREEQPDLQKLYEKYNKCGLDVVAILGEQNEPGSPATSSFCNEWTDEYDLTFNVWTDPLNDYWTPFMGAKGVLPVNLLVSSDWTIQARISEKVDEDFEAAIAGLLGECN